MARLRNLSTSLLKPFQSPDSSHDSSHNRSVSQPLPLQNSHPKTKAVQETDSPSPAITPTQPTQTSVTRRDRASSSRPVSMVYGGPAVDMGRQDVEELMPVFSFLSSHSNKLYQEGYFLKLNDLDTHGRPNADRNWTECFAQLVGTVLSLWDAGALDAAGQDGEVAPTFINLADASIKMIETLPTRNQDVQPLQNVLSVSTAGKNRYLLHFNSLHSLTQWTAGIRLAMFEHASLQELYTGSLIAGKGKHLNSIRTIMEKSKFATEDWARVRFGAGTPWRRCWCVIEPPDEKQFIKQQKSLKKKSPYDRPTHPRGDIKFYDTKKTKKAMPIATITDAYSAYAIYPQSKPLIDQSTLVKVEGKITIHSKPESRTEGFVFVMPEVHPAVSGFEIMLRWLFPVYDGFRLYGRPEKLIADTRATQGLMFAMPKEKRYGYLDIIDVAALIHTDGSDKWTEREWRKQLKDATRKRMDMAGTGRTDSNLGGMRGPSADYGSRNGVRYNDGASIRSQPSQRHRSNMSTDAVFETPRKAGTAPPGGSYPLPAQNYHQRSVSESVMASPTKTGVRQSEAYVPSRLSTDQNNEGVELATSQPRKRDQYWTDRQNENNSQNSSDTELNRPPHTGVEELNSDMREAMPPAPVAAPPSFTHQPGDRPQTRPNVMPELRREKSRMSTATLSQLVDVNRGAANGNAAGNGFSSAGAMAAWKTRDSSRSSDQGPRGVNRTPSDRGIPANQDLRKGMVAQAQYIESPTSVDPESADLQVTKSRQSSSHSIIRKPLPRNPSEHSINRKPVSTEIPPVPQMDGSTLGGTSLLAVPTMSKRLSDSASQYSQSNMDGDDGSEPDFSSRRSSDTRRSESRLRTGVLKSVGNPDMAGDALPQPSNNAIPAVNFGPTNYLTPNPSRPGTGMEKRSSGGTRNDEKRLSYFRSSSPASGMQQTNPPTYQEKVAWQPGSGRQSPGSGPALTAEEFVEQRAVAARTPNGRAPQRSISEQTVPTERPRSVMIHPHSRNPSPSIQQDYSSRLTGKEQEYVARMTGTPLLVNVPNRRRSPDPSVGLVGAIEGREQEKRNMREGVSGQMVQHAIAQRQAHQSQAQMAAAHAANTYAQNQQRMQVRPTMNQEASSYNYAADERLRQQGYGNFQHMQPAQMGYGSPQQQQQGWQNEQWAGQQGPYAGPGPQGQGQGQGQSSGGYYQQAWSGYQRPGQ